MASSKTPLLSASSESSPSQHTWLKYSIASFFFGAVGQFVMGFLSEDITSRFIVSLGDFIFVVFIAMVKFFHFRIKNKRWANKKDCAWIDADSNSFKKGSFKYLLLCITTRFCYGFAIIMAFSEANSNQMNIGIILSIRSSEALFVALWTFLILKERLPMTKLLGLFILTGGVVGLSFPHNSDHNGFSIYGVIWAFVGALVSSFRNYSVKRLAKIKIDGDTIIIHAVFWADLLTVIVGIICSFWGVGFNHQFHDGYLGQDSMEFTWRRFGLSIFAGFAIFFSLTTTANANQQGYAGNNFF